MIKWYAKPKNKTNAKIIYKNDINFSKTWTRPYIYLIKRIQFQIIPTKTYKISKNDDITQALIHKSYDTQLISVKVLVTLEVEIFTMLLIGYRISPVGISESGFYFEYDISLFIIVWWRKMASINLKAIIYIYFFKIFYSFFYSSVDILKLLSLFSKYMIFSLPIPEQFFSNLSKYMKNSLNHNNT